MQMPEMDGMNLGQRIKQDTELNNTILVMLTSLSQRGDAGKMEETGFSACLTKPVKQSHLHDCLSKITGLNKFYTIDRCTKPKRHQTLTSDNKQQTWILLVEDDVINQKVALGILSKLGYQADVVSNGREAVKALEANMYDLVLMDCQMPEMDGYEATAIIRDPDSKVINHKVPVVAMTANAMKGEREKCLASGMDDYISKPIKIKALADSIWKLLELEQPDLQYQKTEEEASPVFDKSFLLSQLGDDTKLTQSILRDFIMDMPHQIRKLKILIENHEIDKAVRQAHKIKGTSANVGGEGLKRIAYEMEKSAKAGNTEILQELMPRIETEYSILKIAIENEFQL
jgi:CheY-like chemotaxis protein